MPSSLYALSSSSLHPNMANHGYSKTAGLNHVIRHEAGHILVYWLLDRPLAGCLVTEQGGLTKIIQTDDTQEQIIPHILVALAGMKMGNDQEAIFELEDHIDNPARFHAKTDSRIVADAMQVFEQSQRQSLFRRSASCCPACEPVSARPMLRYAADLPLLRISCTLPN